MNTLLNPLVVETGETFDTYSFKIVFMNANYNAAGTLWLFQFLIQLVFTILAYLLIRGIFTKDIFEKREASLPSTVSQSTSGLIGWGVTLLYSIIVLLPLITLTLAYPLTVKDLPGRNLYKIILLIVLGMGGVSLHEYLFVRNLEMVGTIFPQMFYGFFSITSVFVLKSIFNGKYSALKIKASSYTLVPIDWTLRKKVCGLWVPFCILE